MSSDTSQNKLKQGRLPFSPVDPKLRKKRKLSNDDKSAQSPKILRDVEEVPTIDLKLASVELSSEIHTAITSTNSGGNSVESARPDEKENILVEIETKDGSSSAKPNLPIMQIEGSNDGIEVIDILIKCDSVPSKNKCVENVKTEQSITKTPKQGNLSLKEKRKRKRSFKNSIANISIDKMFKNIEGKQEKLKLTSPKINASLDQSNKNDDIDIFSCSAESERLQTIYKSDDFEGQTDSTILGLDESQSSLGTLHSTSQSLTQVESEFSELQGKKSEVFTPKSQKDSELSEEEKKTGDVSTAKFQDDSDFSEVDENKSEVSTPKSQSVPMPLKHKFLLPTKKRRLTPNQRQKNEGLRKKKEEKEKLRKEKEEEREKMKEEKQKKKIEEQEAREKEREEKRLKKEDERLKKEEEKQKKEEERLKKEEDKQKKKEEKTMAEEEERERRKAKFAQFFVSKKIEISPGPKEVEKNASGNFILFQVKDNMRIAPLVRSSLSPDKRKQLEQAIDPTSNYIFKRNYLQDIRNLDYIKRRSFKTFPPVEKLEDDDCEILSDGEEIDGTDIVEEKKVVLQKVKLLQFCENRRPAYHGTWSKKSHHTNGRRPFAKEEIFDYDYDSDDDWEEIENGESLSDSEGEGEEVGEDELNQYEVDNEFFVPHGYLSDGEGEEEENGDEDQQELGTEGKEESLQKEKLKQKQEEFELEMKQKTKQLKPKVFGCVWLGDKKSHRAYDQLLKILSPHRAVVIFGTCPLSVDIKDTQSQDHKDAVEEEEEATKKFVKSFPEKAVPDLIRLIHGNTHSKLFLIREFSEHWKTKQSDNCEEEPAGFLAMRKVEPKIQEIGQYGRFSEGGVSLNRRTWYVSKEIREKYGLEDLCLKNSWTYTIPPKERKNIELKDDKAEKNEEKFEKMEEGIKDDTGYSVQMNKDTPKSAKTTLITKFTKVITGEEEKKKCFGSPSQGTQDFSSESAVPLKVSFTNHNLRLTSALTPNQTASGVKDRKVTVKASPKSGSIVELFKNVDKKKIPDRASCVKVDNDLECSSVVELFEKVEKKERDTAPKDSKSGSDFECITLD